MRKPSIDALIVVGPTGVGKSKWALNKARHCGGTIINADSQQCYAACPILTARPSPEDMHMTPHIGYGVLQPDQQTSVGWWLNHVAARIAEVSNPIVVGGTGMYIHALLNGLSDIPPIERATSEAVDQAMQRQDWLDWAHKVDPTLPPTMRDPQRIQRALAVLWQTGKSITAFWQERHYALPGLRAHVVIMEMPPSELNLRLEARLDHMLQSGALHEVRAFARWPHASYKGIQSILGFRELMQYIQGEQSLEATRSGILLRTRQYAKRQRTWFRHHIGAGNLVVSVERTTQHKF